MICAIAVSIAMGACVVFYKAMGNGYSTGVDMVVIAHGGIIWVDYQRFCRYGEDHGRKALPVGRFPLTVEYSKVDGEYLPKAGSLGWIGPSRQCVIVLGQVLGPNGIIPCSDTSRRLTKRIIESNRRGEDVYLEVQNADMV